MTKESGSDVEGGGGAMQVVWETIWLDVQEPYGLGLEAVRSLLDLDLALRYRLPCGSRENSLWLGWLESLTIFRAFLWQAVSEEGPKNCQSPQPPQS